MDLHTDADKRTQSSGPKPYLPDLYERATKRNRVKTTVKIIKTIQITKIHTPIGVFKPLACDGASMTGRLYSRFASVGKRVEGHEVIEESHSGH